jgi:hypothetical protein
MMWLPLSRGPFEGAFRFTQDSASFHLQSVLSKKLLTGISVLGHAQQGEDEDEQAHKNTMGTWSD